MKRVQCGNCGRVRMPSGTWAWVLDPSPEVLGICKPCGDAKKRLDKARLEYQEARTAFRAATPGGLDEYRTEDPFKGFREGE